MTIYYKLHNDKKNISNGGLKDKIQLLNKTNYIIRNTTVTQTKKILWHGLLASKSLLLLKKEWFTENEFCAGISISHIKYNYPSLKHQNSCYLFNNQLDYALGYYFTESKTIKDNINKFFSNLLMTSFTKKLSYKNADEWLKKLSKIPWHIPKDK